MSDEGVENVGEGNKQEEQNNQTNENTEVEKQQPPQENVEENKTTEEQTTKESPQQTTKESPQTEEKQQQEPENQTVEGENKNEGEGNDNQPTEEKKEDANDNIKIWTSKFVDNCSNEELKGFIVFTLEKIDSLSKRLDDQEQLIKILQQSKGGGNLSKIPDPSSELLSNPRKGTIRGKKPPSKPITELGEGITVERPPDSTSTPSEGTTSPSSGIKGGMGMGMMGGMMGELANRLNKRSSTTPSGEKSPMVKNPPMKNPPINPLAVKLKSTGSKGSGIKLPVKN